jgi:hypothetical protein
LVRAHAVKLFAKLQQRSLTALGDSFDNGLHFAQHALDINASSWHDGTQMTAIRSKIFS